MPSRKKPAAPPRSVGLLCDAMESFAPTWAAANWDNVGLLVGNRNWPLTRLLLTIDLTQAVLREALRGRFDAILAYHPPIFRPTKSMIADPASQEGLAAEALAHRIAVYSPHTALDASDVGANAALARLCGLRDLVPFSPAAAPAAEAKLVTFVPAAQVDSLAAALFAAGAGRIGDYQQCSYRVSGQGTFFGADETNPAVGKRGRLERVNEIRIEVVLPRASLPEVVAALRSAHPYEEPAFDLYPLEPHPDRSLGQGRIGRFLKPIALGALARALAARTGAANVAAVGDLRSRLRRAWVCVGSAGTLPLDAHDRPRGPTDVVITGEIRHHDALTYQRCRVSAVALGHWSSERPGLAPLAAMLKKRLPRVTIVLSRRDRDPYQKV